MPFITAKVNLRLDEEQKFHLKTRIGKAMELLPGLSEKYLLLSLEDDRNLYLRGENLQRVAFIEVSVFGNENHIAYDKFSAELTKIFVDVLNIPPLNVYVKFSDINAWSVGGIFFNGI